MKKFCELGIKPFGSLPSKIQLEHLALGKKAFFHFGVNTFTNAEWGDGSEIESLFDPSDIDVPSWIRAIKQAGFKLAILTAKHHDGFCLWPSAHTEHTITKSPYKNGKGDIVKEFTDACRAEGIKAGLYLSPWDRNSPYWGKDEYSDVYLAQLTELLTNYGELSEIWWDGAGSTETVYRWNEWADAIKKYQPNAGIFGSMGATPFVSFRWVGNERGFAGKTHYASIDPKFLSVETPEMLNVGNIGASRYIPAEVDVSIRPGWFYHKDQDDRVKSPLEIDEIWFNSIGNNAMMLLNFPPDRRGRLTDKDVENALESNRHISDMLSTDFAEGAKISAASVHSSDTSAENLLAKDDDFVYASSGDTATIDLYPQKAGAFNVLLIGEKVELGERIVSFRLESVEDEKASPLAEGTSIGYRRAIRFATGAYRHLRLSLVGIAAPIVLRSLSLHYYPYVNATSEERTPDNVAALPSATRENAPDGKSVRVNFGGIYRINVIYGSAPDGTSLTLETFDGTLWHEAAKAISVKGRYDFSFPTEACYQIRISTDKAIAEKLSFVITKS